MPSVSVALGDSIVLGLALVDGQMERLDAFAALRCRGVVSVRSRSSVRRVVPGVGVALGDSIVLGLGVVDG